MSLKLVDLRIVLLNLAVRELCTLLHILELLGQSLIKSFHNLTATINFVLVIFDVSPELSEIFTQTFKLIFLCEFILLLLKLSDVFLHLRAIIPTDFFLKLLVSVGDICCVLAVSIPPVNIVFVYDAITRVARCVSFFGKFF